jgi:hypothetical protein
VITLSSSQSTPNLNKKVPLSFNPQFETSYQQDYITSIKAANLASLSKAFRPDMSHMFKGKTEAGGGLSDTAGVGNVGSSMQTNYHMNYNMIQNY